jgi:hypothetical protein
MTDVERLLAFGGFRIFVMLLVRIDTIVITG